MASFPISAVRDRFPALAATSAGRSRIYLDAAGGTQVCADAIAAINAHMTQGTSNVGGVFETSRATEAMSAEAHAAMADFLGGHPAEIAFGPNMTTLTFAVSRALVQDWSAGDEIILTRLDHDANISPWLRVADDRGMTIRWLDFDIATGVLQLERLPGLLGPKTRLVAVGGASNALGTVNDLTRIVEIVRRHSPAHVYVDAVQWVPHLVTDVAAIGCDFLVCSPYKSFGPHQGVVWGRAELLEKIAAYKVRPATNTPAAIRFETGTPSFESQAGVLGMSTYLEWLGSTLDRSATTRRARLVAAMKGCRAHECAIGERFLAGIARHKRIRLHGPQTMEGRVPTFAITIEGHSPGDVAKHFAERSIFVGAGHFYAVEAITALGLADSGGVLRLGFCHYNSLDEVDVVLAAFDELMTAQ
jgi:cysteine desulfurase family protein (TIGR01976 family)